MKTKSRIIGTKKVEATQMDFELSDELEKEAALLLIQLSCDSENRSTSRGGRSSGGGDRLNGLKDINEEMIAKEESVGDNNNNSGEICSRNEETIMERKKKKFKSVVDLYNQTKPLVFRKHGNIKVPG
ncbi:hypothetical protein LIER_37129 [Lithospermum erythrorhizon]|uniref:Uncharacterized protein n=1 Tax=Lithospermum erythrorhizon TaxID=34254 RepID=A0AAV3PK37_LITER